MKNAIRGRRRLTPEPSTENGSLIIDPTKGANNGDNRSGQNAPDNPPSRGSGGDPNRAIGSGDTVSDFQADALSEEIKGAFEEWVERLPGIDTPPIIMAFAAGWGARGNRDNADKQPGNEPDTGTDEDFIAAARVPSDLDPTAPEAEFSRLEMEGVRAAVHLLAAHIGGGVFDTVAAMLYRGGPLPDVPTTGEVDWKTPPKAPLDYDPPPDPGSTGD